MKEKGGKHLKEIRRSISRARDEHRHNLHEINRINDSVKYSPRGSTHFDKDNLNQASIDLTDQEFPGKNDDYMESVPAISKPKNKEGRFSVTQSVAL